MKLVPTQKCCSTVTIDAAAKKPRIPSSPETRKARFAKDLAALISTSTRDPARRGQPARYQTSPHPPASLIGRTPPRRKGCRRDRSRRATSPSRSRRCYRTPLRTILRTRQGQRPSNLWTLSIARPLWRCRELPGHETGSPSTMTPTHRHRQTVLSPQKDPTTTAAGKFWCVGGAGDGLEKFPSSCTPLQAYHGTAECCALSALRTSRLSIEPSSQKGIRFYVAVRLKSGFTRCNTCRMRTKLGFVRIFTPRASCCHSCCLCGTLMASDVHPTCYVIPG